MAAGTAKSSGNVRVIGRRSTMHLKRVHLRLTTLVTLLLGFNAVLVVPAPSGTNMPEYPVGSGQNSTSREISASLSLSLSPLGGPDLTEADYVRMQLLRQVDASGDGLTKIYVSNADAGDLPLGYDTDSGTMEFPIRSIEHARDVANQAGPVWILLDAQDTWSDNEICTAVGNPYACCTGSETGTCGCSAAGTCEFEETFDPLDPNSLPNEIGIRISSTDPTGQQKPHITCNTLEFDSAQCVGLNDPAPCCTGNTTGSCGGRENASVFGFTPDAGDEGWVVVENIHTSKCGGYDHYSTVTAGAKFLIVGADCTAMRSPVDNSGHCIVLKNASFGISIWGSYNVENDGQGGISNDTLAIVESNGGSPQFIDFFGDYDMSDADYANRDGNTIRVHDDSEAFFVGSLIRNSAENSESGAIRMIDVAAQNAGDTPVVTAVRTVIGMMSNDGDFHDESAAIQPKTLFPSNTINIRLIQSTFANSPVGILTSNLMSSSSVFIYGRGVLWDSPPSLDDFTSYYFNNNLASGTPPAMEFDVDFSKSTFDDGEGANANTREWVVGGTPSSKATCSEALVERAWTNFFDDCDPAYDSDDGAGVPGALDNDGDQFAGFQDLGSCAAEEICDGGFPDVYSEPFPFAIPAFVLGRELTGLVLGGPGGDIGAPVRVPEPSRIALSIAALATCAVVIACRVKRIGERHG